jgi:hypothetical protein
MNSGMNLALVRYVLADALHGQRGTAPSLTFLVATAILNAMGGGPVLPDYAATSVALLPVALWLTVVVCNSEDPVLAAITTVTAGSATRVRLAKLAAAYVACLPLILAALVWPVFMGKRLTVAVFAAGLAAYLITTLAGVGLGALVSRPVIRRSAWAVLVGVAFTLADVIAPFGPPAHQLVVLLSRQRVEHLTTGLAAIAAQTALLAVVAVWLAHRLARSRG